MKKQKRADEDGGGSMHMLSELPEHILNNILCLLSQKESVRTCVLSKSWRHRGSTRSKLELCFVDDFGGNKETLLSVLDNSFQRYHDHSLSMKSLRLNMTPPEGCSSVRLDLHSIALKFEFLRSLSFQGCDIDQNRAFAFKHLRELSLVRVHIASETLEMLLSGSSYSIEYLRIMDCLHFDGKYFPRLKCLCLAEVRLSSESFGFFTSDYMPCLESLELNGCYGFEQFRLSSHSIKRICIFCLDKFTKAAIDAPNIVSFELSSSNPLPTISFTPISSDMWVSHINLWLHANCYNADFPGLKEVLKALSQSQITVQFWNYYHEWTFHNFERTSGGFVKPVVVRNLILRGYYTYFEVLVIFNYFFGICRPRYIYAADNQKHVAIIQKVLLVRKTREYSWNQDLVEVQMQTLDDNAHEWHYVDESSLSENALPNKQEFRFRLKWKE